MANFEGAVFNGRIDFAGKSKEQRAGDLAGVHLMNVDTRRALEQRYKESGPDRFLTISFANVRFGVEAILEGEAIFSGRSFEHIANFTGARFYFPPEFDAATDLNRIDFTGARIGFAPPRKHFHWTSDSTIPLRLRTLRKIAEETKNHDLERDLYIEERKAERGIYRCQLHEELRKATKWSCSSDGGSSPTGSGSVL
jgi:hypothetical protein